MSSTPLSVAAGGPYETEPALRYKRVLLKVSGEVLMGEQPFGIDLNTLDAVASDKIGRAHV